MKIPSRRRHFFHTRRRTIKSRIGKIKETETRGLIDLIHEKKNKIVFDRSFRYPKNKVDALSPKQRNVDSKNRMLCYGIRRESGENIQSISIRWFPLTKLSMLTTLIKLSGVRKKEGFHSVSFSLSRSLSHTHPSIHTHEDPLGKAERGNLTRCVVESLLLFFPGIMTKNETQWWSFLGSSLPIQNRTCGVAKSSSIFHLVVSERYDMYVKYGM